MLNPIRTLHRRLTWLFLTGLFALAVFPSRATISLGPWSPLFKGIDHAMGTNVPGDGLPNQHVAYLIRVDLRDPDVRLFSSPRLEPYAEGSQETGGYTVSDFLSKYRLQVAVNAGLFDPAEYYLPAGTPMDIHGLSICEGTLVSEQKNASEAATLAFTADNVPTIIHTNWPPVPTTDMHTAVSGSYPLVVNGVNNGYNFRPNSEQIHRTNPRTALGITEDKRFLYIVVIDGRQPGYSNGAYDYETAAWFLHVGASDAINMDGGGSTTLVVEDSTGRPQRLNKSSAVADSGRERTVGSHFGIYSKPVPGFINDVVATPDDTTAIVTWNTTEAATSQVRYGPSTDLEFSTPLDPKAVTRHSVALTQLKPGTAYFFQAVSGNGTAQYQSPTRTFTTSNHVTSLMLVDLPQAWKFTTDNLDGVPWTSRTFDDSAWEGQGAGLLWADSRGTPRAGVQPATTVLPTDPGSGGFPFPAYYFRTRFAFAGDPTGVSLVFTNYIDDGAVYYLNGIEVQRLRMDAAPALVSNNSLATGFGCSGDATCPEVFVLSGDPLTPLVSGENVLAAEVHNYNARSPDLTFGLTLTAQIPVVTRPTLAIRSTAGALTLEWAGGGFVLQESTSPEGPWLDVPGPVIQSPYVSSAAESARFFRLRK